jgi:transposase
VETDPTRALAWLIGLPVQFLGGEDGPDGEARIYVQSVRARGGCPSCGSVASGKDYADVELIDLTDLRSGRPTGVAQAAVLLPGT